MYTTFGTYIENFDSQSNFIIEHATQQRHNNKKSKRNVPTTTPPKKSTTTPPKKVISADDEIYCDGSFEVTENGATCIKSPTYPIETQIDKILNNIYNHYKDKTYIDFIIISINNKLTIISNDLLKKINNLLNTNYRSSIKVILFDLLTSFGNINIYSYNYPQSIELLIREIQSQYHLDNDNISKNINKILNNININK